MKKFITIALLALFATACTPTEKSEMMGKGMMCEKCPCCQKMMGGGAMQDEMMKEGMQCKMMDKAKDGKSCGCCDGMGKNSMTPIQSLPPIDKDNTQHNAHHLNK